MITGKDLLDLGFKPNSSIGVALNISNEMLKNNSIEEIKTIFKDILNDPFKYSINDSLLLKELALSIISNIKPKTIELIKNPIDYKIYGLDNIEQGALDQMNIAMSLPISRKGALMPDAHQGYGLPIGGVLATENSVIPYAVGVDIGCRMRMTIYDMGDEDYINKNKDKLKKILYENTKFGFDEVHSDPIDHELFSNPLFNEIRLLNNLKDKAFKQIGTSGSGNHFTNFGDIEILIDNDLGIKPGKYIAVLSHSGSRGFGAKIADHYSKLAMKITKLPKEAQHLAWLDMNTQEGIEYWKSMNLALDYASACHHDIHNRIERFLGAEPITTIENHHNFASKEIHDNKEYIVHRKGSTPASLNEYGIIPGTMTDYGYIVRGLGNKDSLNSASHGAGRAMSRNVAKKNYNENYMKSYLKEKGVILIGGDVDEIPMAYKNIDEVMKQQEDLVEKIGRFTPKIVRMADKQVKRW